MCNHSKLILVFKADNLPTTAIFRTLFQYAGYIGPVQPQTRRLSKVMRAHCVPCVECFPPNVSFYLGKFLFVVCTSFYARDFFLLSFCWCALLSIGSLFFTVFSKGIRSIHNEEILRNAKRESIIFFWFLCVSLTFPIQFYCIFFVFCFSLFVCIFCSQPCTLSSAQCRYAETIGNGFSWFCRLLLCSSGCLCSLFFSLGSDHCDVTRYIINAYCFFVDAFLCVYDRFVEFWPFFIRQLFVIGTDWNFNEKWCCFRIELQSNWNWTDWHAQQNVRFNEFGYNAHSKKNYAQTRRKKEVIVWNDRCFGKSPFDRLRCIGFWCDQ